MNRPMLKGKTDYCKSAQIIAKNALLFHLAATNIAIAAFWVQIWDVAVSTDIGKTETLPDFEIAVPPNGGVLAFPFHKEGWQMWRGIYVCAVTASGGSSLIGGNSMKLSYQYDGPLPIS